MGADASKPLSLEELRALWNKHDSNGTGELELGEVSALLDDVRLRFGIEEPLEPGAVQVIFEMLDTEGLGFWTWHEFRQLSGEAYFKVHKTLQRRRIRANMRHARANRGRKVAQPTGVAGMVQGAKQAVVGADAARSVKKAAELGETMAIVLHPMRVWGVRRDPSAFFFRPTLLARIVRGNPRKGMDHGRNDDPEFLRAAMEGPAAAEVEITPTETEDDLIWKESAMLEFKGVKSMFLHLILKDTAPLGDAVFPVEDVMELQEEPRVIEFQVNAVEKSRLTANTHVLCQFGGRRPRYRTPVYVYRGENLSDGESLVVELVMKSKDGTVLFTGRSPAAMGPQPMWRSEVVVECNDEGGMQLHCKIYITRLLSADEPIAELVTPIPQREMTGSEVTRRRVLRPLGGASAGGFITLAFGEVKKDGLFMRPRTAMGLACVEGAPNFNPFVKATVLSSDPRAGVPGSTIAEAKTETLNNCTGDPYWKEPIILDVVRETGCFVSISACDDRLGVSPDRLGEIVMTLEEACDRMSSPLEEKFPLRLLVPRRRHADPFLWLSFGEMGGAIAKGPQAVDNGAGGAAASGAAPASPGGGGAAAVGGGGGGGRGLLLGGKYVPPLAQVLQNTGFNPPPELLEHMTLAPQPRSAGFEPEYVQQERRRLEENALQIGGAVRGHVPLSFFGNGANPHAAWIYNPPGRR